VGARAAYRIRHGGGAGKAHVYFGGDPMDSVLDLVLQDSDLFYRYGFAVGSAGDVNKDGYDDAMVAAPDGEDARGRVFIYFGAEEMDSLYEVHLVGHPDSSEHLGRSMAGIGDINSDGYDDILAGSPYAGTPWGTGKASIYFGGRSMDAIPDVTFWGEWTEFKNFGANVASAGDVDGDRLPDILVGNAKKTKIFFGSWLSDTSSYLVLPAGKSISSAGDLNQDGFGDLIISDSKDPGSSYIFYGGPEMDAKADIVLKAEDSTLAGFGIKVVGLGDINGDGYDEVMVSSKGDSLYYGIAFIYTSNPTPAEATKKGEGKE